MKTKKCASCLEVLGIDLFFKSSKYGVSGYCKKCSVAKQKEWSEKNREHKNDHSRKWNAKKPGYCSAIQGRVQAQLRAEVLSAYGNKCVRCGITDMRILTIEHKDGGGKADLKNSKSLWTILRRIKDEGFPDCFTVLCRNCNISHGANCRKKPSGLNGKAIARVHLCYDAKCARCSSVDALDIDHVWAFKNPVYRAVPARRSASLAKWIIATQGWSLFQLLCQNCNWIKMLEEDSLLASTSVPEEAWHGLDAESVFTAVRNGTMTGDVVTQCGTCKRNVLQQSCKPRIYCSKDCSDRAYNIACGKCSYKRKPNHNQRMRISDELIIPMDAPEDKQGVLF